MVEDAGIAQPDHRDLRTVSAPVVELADQHHAAGISVVVNEMYLCPISHGRAECREHLLKTLEFLRQTIWLGLLETLLPVFKCRGCFFARSCHKFHPRRLPDSVSSVGK